ncbi:methyltransferase domain-containing protein [uncultured Jatrophihabitans sp.]|uniref:methyltransferase domain-containing protein n=1 Tax=uncultured Jatrophihabitans sp. TaxID=1610747 RepID=UPI0035CC7732
MEAGALAPFERALGGGGPLGLCTDDGRVVTLDVRRWLAVADAADETVLSRCVAPVIDMGCGPGRLVTSLSERGVPALGVDIAETAVALNRERGMLALRRNVFDDLPGEGRWPTALLIDGNIGIGGDPARLLRRVRALLAADGRVLVEVAADDDADDVLAVRFTEHGRPVGPLFDWALVGRRALARYAAAGGYSVVESWSASGREFCALSGSALADAGAPRRSTLAT